MPQQLLKVRPTKIEFIKLKRRLSLAGRVQRIMKEKLSILTLEFLQAVKETVEAKRKLLGEFSEAYKALSIAVGYHGYVALEKELIATEGGSTVAASSRSIVGVRIPSLELVKAEKAIKGYNLVNTSSLLDDTAQSFQKCLEAIVDLAELQRSLELLGMEISRTRRIVNALEYVVIPALQMTIRYLHMKFEERSREEKVRLKRVKVLLQRR